MIIQQPSQLLTQYGILHGIAGVEYNFKREGEQQHYRNMVEEVCLQLNISTTQLYQGIQTHSSNVAVVPVAQVETSEYFGGYPIIPNVDGFVTQIPHTTLLIRHADCTPIILFDPKNHVLAAVHSGWRSTVSCISGVALEKMNQLAGTQPQEVCVFIGPSIDQEHYQVGSEVYAAFEQHGQRERYFKEDKDGKYRLNMIEANRYLLEKQGVNPDCIECSNESTYTSQRLHSARYEGQNYQLNATLVMLPEK